MKSKIGIKYLIFPIILALLLMIPENVVWGGLNFQTVPTIGPTNTPTRTKSPTATQPISAQTLASTSTSTSALISPVTSTSTLITEATQELFSETPEPDNTMSNSATEEPSKSESTSFVVLPVVSNGDSIPGDQSSQDSKPVPAFVFPLVVVLLFVIIYLSTKFSLKKSRVEKSTQNNE